MQEYYNNIGPEAWQDELVPLQISSNKNLAADYASVIVAQINDWYTTHSKTAHEEPFYIIEIGAGHGKLGFYVLKHLQTLMANYNLPFALIKFIMTDIAEKNMQSWVEHPALQPWVESGSLDFAIFNAMSDSQIVLNHSKAVIKPGTLQKPIFMLCNYLFDSLSHDAFQVRKHALHEVQIKIDSDADWNNYFAKAKFSYEYVPVSTNYYSDANLNKILEHYAAALEDGTFMIPVGGIDCINTVKQFTTQHLVLLLADKGQASIDFFDDLEEPDIDIHGSISLMVNFDALKHYFTNSGGKAFLMPNLSVDFQVACFITAAADPMLHTKNAFTRAVSGASPQDIVNLCYIDDEINTNFKNLDQLLAMLNLTMWDPNTFYDLHEMILDRIEIEEITVEQDHALLNGCLLVWEYFFKLEKTQDLPFALGGVYYALDEYELALKFFQLSIDQFGENAENLYNMAITYQAMDSDAEATKYVKEALKFDPNYRDAKELLAELV
ncbi:MAG TPA: SAM-dependent methyltransferase [Gammaproteobacteria bacterium]|nr:SAM-dependent methyltransferase [Gammaproteobacteria bacterium]